MMIDLEERLRSELARSTAGIRATGDPVGRLLSGYRRQRRGRAGALASAAVAALVVVLTGGAAALTGGRPAVPERPQPTVTRERPVFAGTALTTWTRKLLAGPTRGNLASNGPLVAQLTAALAANHSFWRVDPALNKVKLLLVADVAGARTYQAAYYNDTHAEYVSSAGPAGASVAKLAHGEYGGATGPLEPFPHGGEGLEPTGLPSYYFVTALAPPGCVIATSTQARVRADGTLAQTWVDQGDYLVRPGREDPMWWRVTCDGTVRELDLGSPRPTPVNWTAGAGTERGHIDPNLVTRAFQQWQTAPGLAVTRYRALWGGTPQGSSRPVVVLAGELRGGGVQVCAVTGTGRDNVLLTAVAGRNSALRSAPAGGPIAATTTATAPSTDLVAVRLPDVNATGLSNQLLVVAPPGATQLQVSGTHPQTVPLHDGAALVTVKAPARVTLRAVTANGTALAALTLAEPDTDGFAFGQGLVKQW